MKKSFIALAVCTFVSVGSASASDVIPAEELAAARATCQGVFPELTTKLQSWSEHQKVNSTLQAVLAKHDYGKAAECLVSAKEMDVLYPRIVELSSNLINSLAALQAKYPEADKKLQKLLGIEDQYKGIIENLALFISLNKK